METGPFKDGAEDIEIQQTPIPITMNIADSVKDLVVKEIESSD